MKLSISRWYLRRWHAVLKQFVYLYDDGKCLVEYSNRARLRTAFTAAELANVNISKYEKVRLMNFGQAIEKLKAGKSVKREGWNGKDQYVYMITGKELSKGLKYGYGEYEGEPEFVSVLAMKTTANQIQVGWLATQTDMLAKDWIELDAVETKYNVYDGLADLYFFRGDDGVLDRSDKRHNGDFDQQWTLKQISEWHLQGFARFEVTSGAD
jgi:hypothetical protein